MLFFLGLLILVEGGLSINRLGLSSTVEVATVVVGFVILSLGVVLE